MDLIIPISKKTLFYQNLEKACQKYYYNFTCAQKIEEDKCIINIIFTETNYSHIMNDQYLRLLEEITFYDILSN